ncbi:MAG: YceI family protein [Bacteroidales bacterium]|nr:YceI family protein [Bacteroidales bacterium]
MKRIKFLAVFAMAAIVMASCGGGSDKKAEIIEKLEAGEIPEEVTRVYVDVNASEVAWTGQKITGSGHNGTIGIKEGVMYDYDGKIWGGNMVIDMTQIVVLDLTDPEMNARLKGHLESDDFFSVATHPEATFEIVRLEPIEGAASGEANYRISGNLTIKEITHSLAFNALVNHVEGGIDAYADFDFDRSLYEVRFGSGRFFDNLGDNLINDNINLKINLVARY